MSPLEPSELLALLSAIVGGLYSPGQWRVELAEPNAAAVSFLVERGAPAGRYLLRLEPLESGR